MNGQFMIRIVGFITAGAVFLAGMAVLLGFLLPAYIPQNYRTIFGIVLIVYGIYRSIMLWIQGKRLKRYDEE